MKKVGRITIIVSLGFVCLLSLCGRASAYEPRYTIGYFLEIMGNGNAELSGYPLEIAEELFGYGIEVGYSMNRHIGLGVTASRLAGTSGGVWRGGWAIVDYDMENIPVLMSALVRVGRPNGTHLGVFLSAGGVLESLSFYDSIKVRGIGYITEFGAELAFNIGQWSPNQWMILYFQVMQKFVNVPKLKYTADVDTNGDGVVDYAKGDEIVDMSGNAISHTGDGGYAKLGLRVVF